MRELSLAFQDAIRHVKSFEELRVVETKIVNDSVTFFAASYIPDGKIKVSRAKVKMSLYLAQHFPKWSYKAFENEISELGTWTGITAREFTI